MAGIPRRSTESAYQNPSPAVSKKLRPSSTHLHKTLSMLAVAKSDGGIATDTVEPSYEYYP